jgi:hypothetical protein
MAKQTGLWLLPWASVLMVSGTVAFAGVHAAQPTSLDRSAQLEIAGVSTAAGMAAVAGAQWVLLSSANPETRVSCLTPMNRVSADMLYVHAEELDRLAAEVCIDGLATSATGF